MAMFNTNFFVRTLSALVLGPVVMWLIYKGNEHFIGLAAVINIALLWEWERMMSKEEIGPFNLAVIISGLIALLTYVYILMFVTDDESLYMASNVMLVASGLTIILTLLTQFYRKSFFSFFGPIYIFASMVSLVSLRLHGNDGLILTINLFAVVWATDIGAYLAGRTFQGPKILPIVSPSKTWSGLVGGMICSIITLYLLQKYSPYGLSLSLQHLAILGAGSAVIAQVGDFLESGFKRICKIKDSSNIIPGHGGVFDRMDGVMSVAIFWLYIVCYSGFTLVA